MRRLGRYIYAGLTVLSLLVCLATGVVWARGAWYTSYLAKNEKGYGWEIELLSHEIRLQFSSSSTLDSTQLQWRTLSTDQLNFMQLVFDYRLASFDGEKHHWEFSGLSFDSVSARGGGSAAAYLIRFTLSYWLIVLLTLILPASRIRFRRRNNPGLCPKCRYDLRATPQRCPECGTVVAEAGEKTD